MERGLAAGHEPQKNRWELGADFRGISFGPLSLSLWSETAFHNVSNRVRRFAALHRPAPRDRRRRKCPPGINGGEGGKPRNTHLFPKRVRSRMVHPKSAWAFIPTHPWQGAGDV